MRFKAPLFISGKTMELQNQLKQMAAKAALEYVVEGEYLGVGTGTTVGFFITELATSGKKVKGCVSSSEATTRQLLAYGIPVCDLNDIVDYLPVYIDGCDEIDGNFCMIKGGGGALTREKMSLRHLKNLSVSLTKAKLSNNSVHSLCLWKSFRWL